VAWVSVYGVARLSNKSFVLNPELAVRYYIQIVIVRVGVDHTEYISHTIYKFQIVLAVFNALLVTLNPLFLYYTTTL
jgi:hypothetical protein